ncbi:MAG: hypothetical protein RLY93_19050 [Sumerlaeia bacterium]
MKVPFVLPILAAMTLGTSATLLAADPLQALNDEFETDSLTDWSRVKDAEMWPNEQLEVLDIDVTRDGWMTMVPYTNGWYEDYRGPLVFKEVTGDFVVTTRVQATNRAGTGAPERSYSLAGLMIRAPRAITPATWTAGGEKYSFLSIGSANTPGTFQYEVKSTSNEDELPEYSRLDISASDCSCGDTLLQTARLGQYVIQLAKTATGDWRIVNRYRRPDLPAVLQVGFVTYTDWPNVEITPVETHNTTTLTEVLGQPGVPTQPDLRAQFEYIRFLTPEVPPVFAGLDLANAAEVSDAELLSFLGENAVSAFASVGDFWMAF